MNWCQILDFIFINCVIKILNVNNLDKFGFYLRFYVLKSVKEVVGSRVESQVEALIVRNSFTYNSQQINVIFVFLYFEICINVVKIFKDFIS